MTRRSQARRSAGGAAFGPSAFADLGQGGQRKGLEGPELPTPRDVETRRERLGRDGDGWTGVGGSHFDPLRKIRNGRIGQFASWWHAEVEVRVRNRLQELAVFGLAGNDDRGRWAIETQVRFWLPEFGAVAAVAALRENRPDAGLEEFDALGSWSLSHKQDG